MALEKPNFSASPPTQLTCWCFSSFYQFLNLFSLSSSSWVQELVTSGLSPELLSVFLRKISEIHVSGSMKFWNCIWNFVHVSRKKGSLISICFSRSLGPPEWTTVFLRTLPDLRLCLLQDCIACFIFSVRVMTISFSVALAQVYPFLSCGRSQFQLWTGISVRS